MDDLYLHEEIYRGKEALQKLEQVPVTVCGAGALGSLLVDNLARQGFRQLSVIDDDRVELHNIGTQLFRQEDVGAFKVDVLRGHCFRAAGIEIGTFNKRLTENTVHKFLRGAQLVIDTFDNSASRRTVSEYCDQNELICLHLGMNADYGEVHWNENYRVPQDVVAADVCEYPLARNLILLVVAAGSEAILRFVLENCRENYTITLKDLSIQKGEG
jgi:molybdopterin/thiamine biosynthesis adenylyltransferase